MQEIESDLRKQRAKIKEVEKEYIENAKVIGATLSKCAIDSLIYERTFDLVVVDEVSMAFVPQIALAASLGKRIVVCGDFLQLPPIAMANHELVRKWLGEDMFYHAGIVESVNKSEAHPNLFMLQEQRRMHADISKFTNSFIYKIGYMIIHQFQNVKNLRNCSRSQMKQVFYLIRAKWELFR